MDMSEKKKQKIPKWFNGMIYDKGEVVANPFTGESFELNNIELSIYDFIMGSQHVMAIAPKAITPKQIKDFDRALTWFRVNNPTAYMVLLD
jgi:hypothetical protein